MEGSSASQTNPISTQYKESIWRRVKRNWHPTRDGFSCRDPIFILEVHKTGLVLDVDVSTKSDCESLQNNNENALWFAAPYERLPSDLDDAANFRIIVTPGKMSDSSVKLMQPSAAAINPTHAVFNRDIPPGLYDQFDNLRNFKVMEVDSYFRTHNFPRSIPFLISKNLWMQVLNYRQSNVYLDLPLQRILSTLPSDWLETAQKNEISTTEAELDKQFHSGIDFRKDRKFCVKLADFMQMVATASTKPKSNPDPSVAE
jgi:hypothetical protein